MIAPKRFIDRQKVPPPVKRLRETKRMTIAIGILAGDGIVIASDSEESDQYFKRSQSKVSLFHNEKAGTCAVSGAGNSAGHIDTLAGNMGKRFLDTLLASQESALEKNLGECVEEFHARHIFPCNEHLEATMLLGATYGSTTSIWVTSKSTIRQVAPYGAVGIGSAFAQSMLDRLWRMMPVASIEILAAYVMFQTKEYVDGCGKATSIISLQNSNPGFAYMPDSDVEALERAFRKDWSKREENLLWELIESIELNQLLRGSLRNALVE